MADPDWSPAARPGYSVLLVAYGAPQSLDDVAPYLSDVRGGRAISPELVEELRRRYAAIGGGSPLLDRTREQAAALCRALGGVPVHVGMRHWHPHIPTVLREMAAAGTTRVVALALAPHFSHVSIGAYQRTIEQGRGRLDVAMVSHWYDHPGFVEAVVERVREALGRLPVDGRDRAPVIYTAHAIPQRFVDAGDPYAEQVAASATAVAAKVGTARPIVAFQSAGRTPEPWLGPDLHTVLREAAAGGARAVVVCPIGFVSDHLEVLYDVDVEAREVARSLGMRLERSPSLNASPRLISALADLACRTAAARGWA